MPLDAAVLAGDKLIAMPCSNLEDALQLDLRLLLVRKEGCLTPTLGSLASPRPYQGSATPEARLPGEYIAAVAIAAGVDALELHPRRPAGYYRE